MEKKFKIGNADIQEHINWVERELTPPITANKELAYILNCFRQTLLELKNRLQFYGDYTAVCARELCLTTSQVTCELTHGARTGV